MLARTRGTRSCTGVAPPLPGVSLQPCLLHSVPLSFLPRPPPHSGLLHPPGGAWRAQCLGPPIRCPPWGAHTGSRCCGWLTAQRLTAAQPGVHEALLSASTGGGSPGAPQSAGSESKRLVSTSDPGSGGEWNPEFPSLSPNVMRASPTGHTLHCLPVSAACVPGTYLPE